MKYEIWILYDYDDYENENSPILNVIAHFLSKDSFDRSYGHIEKCMVSKSYILQNIWEIKDVLKFISQNKESSEWIFRVYKENSEKHSTYCKISEDREEKLKLII